MISIVGFAANTVKIHITRKRQAPISDETLVFAARLAAENSKLSASPKAAVDYTPIKYVKKPNGAKAGMVIYTTNKTLFVTPGGV